jgi:hypothetical protein
MGGVLVGLVGRVPLYGSAPAHIVLLRGLVW